MKSFLRHSFEFILVFAVIIAAIGLLEVFHESSTRLIIISLLSVFYVAVGVFHHWEEKNLKLTQVLEHLAIGFFIFLILQALYQ
ncbi:MAG TPA: hypothetical protein VIH52_03010 [Candidatus Nanoarchaeia archaeon]|nr:hypothetical protein [uncultured archaeon]